MRHDHTKWLIHFVRDRNPEQDFCFYDDYRYNKEVGGELDIDSNAFEVLKHIINTGLKPGYSFRNNQTTIYGGYPAICASEMPIYSFSQYVKKTNNTKRVSSYGIAFLKSEFFSAGGRPVIYGLSDNTAYQKMFKNDYDCRIFDDSVLPEHEQYRYVTYSPSGDKWVDWSHEREWRWCELGDQNSKIDYQDIEGTYVESPGLPLFSGTENDGYFSQVAIIVWSSSEAEKIQQELTRYYFSESNEYGVFFSRDVIRNSIIIILDDVVRQVEKNSDIDSQTIEGLKESSLFKSVLLHNELPSSEVEAIKEAISKAEIAGKIASLKYIKADPPYGFCGFAYVVTDQLTHPIVQTMIRNGWAEVYGGIATVGLKYKITPKYCQCIEYKESINSIMAAALNNYLNVDIFYMKSRLD